LTNYKKDGLEFQNLFSMKPVHDSNGVYRYTVGVQCEVAAAGPTNVETKAIKSLMKQLPSTFDASLQPLAEPTAEDIVNSAARNAQLHEATTQFTKLVWMSDPAVTLPKLLDREDFCSAYREFLKKEYADGELQMIIDARKMDLMPGGPAQEEAAKKVWDEHVAPGGKRLGGGNVADQVRAENMKMLVSMGADSFPRFLETSECHGVAEAVVQEGNTMRRADLLWKKYKVPADVAEWMYAFVGAAETYPACVVISDMSIPGNPMVFVNQEFCNVTRYENHEVVGRNCRFLQGPQTEPQSVAVIQDTLRRGVDCHVRITNYRKNGETFQNLLSMRPVHDSHGVYRFCIGVQFEVGSSSNLKQRLLRLDRLLQLLPDKIEVQTRRPVGLAHKKDPVAANVGKSASELLEGALKNTEAVKGTDIFSAARYGGNREVLLQELKSEGPVADAKKKSPNTVNFPRPPVEAPSESRKFSRHKSRNRLY
jgi:PAS domain S-box-containing protein